MNSLTIIAGQLEYLKVYRDGEPFPWRSCTVGEDASVFAEYATVTVKSWNHDGSCDVHVETDDTEPLLSRDFLDAALMPLGFERVEGKEEDEDSTQESAE